MRKAFNLFDFKQFANVCAHVINNTRFKLFDYLIFFFVHSLRLHRIENCKLTNELIWKCRSVFDGQSKCYSAKCWTKKTKARKKREAFFNEKISFDWTTLSNRLKFNWFNQCKSNSNFTPFSGQILVTVNREFKTCLWTRTWFFCFMPELVWSVATLISYQTELTCVG